MLYSQNLCDWFQIGTTRKNWTVKPFSAQQQLKTSTLQFMKTHADALLDYDIARIAGHAGFAGTEIFRWSTFTIIRCKDHERRTSAFMKDWIRRHDVERISCRDLKQI